MDTTTDITQQRPTTIRAFLEAQTARDDRRAIPLLTEDAVIVDVPDSGGTFAGEDGLRRFVVEAGTEFTYTTELSDVRQDGEVWVVRHHLDGDFPGGQVDLDYRFTLDGDFPGGQVDLDYRFTLDGDRISHLDVVLP